MSTIQTFLKTEWTSFPLNGHNGRNVRKKANLGAILNLIGSLLQCPTYFAVLTLLKIDISDAKTGEKRQEKPRNREISRFFGEDKRDRTADLLNAMASGGGQNEYIWIKWTK